MPPLHATRSVRGKPGWQITILAILVKGGPRAGTRG